MVFLLRHRCINLFIYMILVLSGTMVIQIFNRSHIWRSIDTKLQIINKKQEEISVDPECECIGSDYTRYDFCYRLPENRTVTGKRFNCQQIEILQDLDLLDYDDTNLLDLSQDDMPDPVFVTAFSRSHVHEGYRLIDLIRQYFPHQKVILYDLGLGKDLVKFIGACNVEIRSFNFTKFGERVKFLQEYRWKPILIAEALKDYKSVFYMDSSVIFLRNDWSHVYDLLRCHINSNPNNNVSSSEERDHREAIQPHESGWNQTVWKSNLAECKKAPYLLHSYTSHGIYAATSKGVYNYIPTNFAEIKKPKAKMYEAGFALVARTKEIVEYVLKWYVMCALEPECMAPPGSQLGCSFGADRFSTYAGCHRFDQSVVNILLANQFWYDRHFYSSEIVDFFRIQRGGRSAFWEGPLKCLT